MKNNDILFKGSFKIYNTNDCFHFSNYKKVCYNYDEKYRYNIDNDSIITFYPMGGDLDIIFRRNDSTIITKAKLMKYNKTELIFKILNHTDYFPKNEIYILSKVEKCECDN